MQLLLSLVAFAIFGQSVEGALGRLSYIGAMLAGALVALATQLSIGAHHGALTLACAGAAAAVVGTYVALYPRARVYSVLFAPLFSAVFAIPALLLVGVWLGLQIALGLGFDEPLASIGGAWFAHLAAIATGLLLAWPLTRFRRDHDELVSHPTARPAA